MQYQERQSKQTTNMFSKKISSNWRIVSSYNNQKTNIFLIGHGSIVADFPCCYSTMWDAKA